MKDHLQNYFSRKRSLGELLHLTDDDSGYIEGRVFMIWSPRNRLRRINLEVVEDSTLYRFEVEVPSKDGISFRPHEGVCLALKGARIRRKESSAPHSFPIVLRFPDGVVLKYLSGINAGKVVDTWEGSTDEWYNPGLVHSVSNAVTIDASGVNPHPTVTCLPMSTISRTDVTSCDSQDVRINQPSSLILANADNAATVQSMQSAQQPSDERPCRPNKGRTRKKRRLLREKEKGSAAHTQPVYDSSKPPLSTHATPCHEQSQASIHTSSTKESDTHPELHQINGHVNGGASVLRSDEIQISCGDDHNNKMTIPEETENLTVRLKAGIRTQRGDIFTALAELQKGHSFINVIGIVVRVTPEAKTRTNEWRRSITLVDPSILDLPHPGITVNCFQKTHPEWLPQVQNNDIVILRKLKVVEFNGRVTATGYGDKLRWAVYDLSKLSVRVPNKGNAPEKEWIDGGMGYEYSPYWEPSEDSIELEYCREIGEWWKAKRTLEGERVSTVECSGPVPKRHLLICEASPDHPPYGFFNCTVEILQKFSNYSDTTTVYVTDYTPNALMRSVQATWCPSQLCDRVLQCNMWDAARHVAKMMNPGEYWYLHNVRARWNPNHHMEATMQLAEKLSQLDETKLEVHPHLKALLARKQEFESNHSGLASESASLHIFPEMLLQDVEESTSFLTCIVELLHIELNSRDGHFLYVTDYTYNPDLPATISTADWTHNLEHRLVKIKLDDAQAKISSELRPSSVCVIQNVRIKRSSSSGSVHGCLGGGDTLIIPLNDPTSSQFQKLQKNKEKWLRENMLNVPTVLSNGSQADTHGLLKESLIHSSNTTLQEVLVCPAPIKLKVLARAMDFFPFSLEDACVLRCTKCKSSPPPSFRGCPRCDDMMETHCKWFYCLYMLLRDEKDNEIIVSLSGKECALLQGIDPSDFRRDQEAFRMFLAKLDPVLGNLKDVHLAWSRNIDKAIESPLMMFTLESWNFGDEKGYSLLDCVSA